MKKRSAAERRGVLWLLAHSSVEAEPFVRKLSKEDKAVWSELSGSVRDPLEDPLRELHDVNELWGRYVASRRLAPLQRLIWALDADGGVITTESVWNEEHQVDVPLARVVTTVVAKNLAQGIAWDPLARSYAETLARSEDIPDGVRSRLEELLAAPAPK
ncbi:MAG: hypothetical protein HOP15_03495 [Planctomycetes bacterium]|nr:hypothetical protein [Planctomycetota bacterium]